MSEEASEIQPADGRKLIGISSILLVLIVLLLVTPRLFWGLPNELRAYSLHPDEFLNALVSRQIEPTSLKFTPSFYNYGTLPFTFWRIFGDIALAVSGGATGANLGPAEFRTLHLVGRGISLVAYLSVVLLVFQSSRIMYRSHIGSVLGVIFAALVAVNPIMHRHSTFQTVDMVGAAFVMLTIYCSIRAGIVESEKTRIDRWLVLAAIAAGLAASVKYSGIVVWAAIPGALLYRKEFSVKRVLPALLTVAVVFVVTTPGCILEREAFLRDVKFEMQHVKDGHGLAFAATENTIFYHFGSVMSSSPFAVLFLTFALGIGLRLTFQDQDKLAGASEIKNRVPKTWISLFVCVPFVAISLFILAGGSVKFERYLVPLIAPMALCIAALCPDSLNLRKMNSLDNAVPMMLFACCLASLSYKTYAMDSRDVIGPEYVKKAKEFGKTIGVAKDPWFWSATLFPEQGQLRGPWGKLADKMTTAEVPILRHIRAADGSDRQDFDVDLLTQEKPHYVIITALEERSHRRLLKLYQENPKSVPDEYIPAVKAYQAFVKELEGKYTLELEKGTTYSDNLPEDAVYVDPQVRVWVRKE